MKEEDVQKSVIELFTVTGWEVLQTSRRGVMCNRCHRRAYGGDGATMGLPDLFVTRKGRTSWMGIEIKGEKTPVSPEQQRLVDLGYSCIVRSLDEAIKLEKELRQ